ncbi:MAG: DUF4296 domain-containing protein [Balneola sp.]
MKKLLIIVFPLLLLLGCKEENYIPKPEPLMEEAQYLDLLLELKILKVYQSRGASGKVVDSLYTEIFLQHDADTALFRKSHAYYQAQTVLQQERVDSLIVRLNKEIQPFNELNSDETQEEEVKE